MRYIGLAKNAMWCSDLEYVFVVVNSRLFRMDESKFHDIMKLGVKGKLLSVIDQYPDLFCEYRSQNDAVNSYELGNHM